MKKSILFSGIIVIALLVVIGGLWMIQGKSLMTSSFSPHNYAVIKTNKGDIEIQLFNDKAPNMTENFQKLAEAGKYNTTIFHRVINGFMIQGGDYEYSNGTGGQAWNGQYLPDEIVPGLSHVRGMVSMANKGPNTNGSQFFIVQRDALFLDGHYSIFGQVVSGMDIVDQIAQVPTDKMDKPLEPITIQEVTLKD